jgi:putative membrane protein
MPLAQAERDAISRHVAEAEARTGAQIVAAVVPRSDSYPHLPWKAFSLAASLGALVGLATVVLRPDLPALHAGLLVAVEALGAGAALALAAVFIPPVSRALLDAHRVEVEVRQQAQGLFLSHELFRTERRVGVLILMSELERRVVVLADVGLQARLRQEELERVVSAMVPVLRAGRAVDAFAVGLDTLGTILANRGIGPAPGNELPDEVVEEGR